jgi:8-oxo-dGTP pyrophosphatase MutT (NUDIX family)
MPQHFHVQLDSETTTVERRRLAGDAFNSSWSPGDQLPDLIVSAIEAFDAAVPPSNKARSVALKLYEALQPRFTQLDPAATPPGEECPMQVCAACAIQDDQDRFLLGWHVKHKGWEFPGGKKKPGENAVRCVVRETVEETGLGLDLDTLQLVTCYEQNGWLTLLYRARPVDPAAVRDCEPDKHHSFRYFSLAELPKPLTYEVDEDLMHVIAETKPESTLIRSAMKQRF